MSSLSSLIFVAVAIAGCSGASSGQAADVSAAQFGSRWPLTVSGGTLRCEHGSAIVFEANGTEYALNGTAMSYDDYADVRPIWADNTELGLGLKKDIGTLIDRGLELCD